LILVVLLLIGAGVGVFYLAGVAEEAAGTPEQQRIDVDVDLSR
jgi:hypothetical protein